VTYPI